MIVSINQPAYLPWLGYFDRIHASDIHVILDHVQFEKNSFVNRNKIRTPQGQMWLTIPLATKGKFNNLPINQLSVANQNKWCSKHLKSIQANYAKALNFNILMPMLEEILTTNDESTFLPIIMTLNDMLAGILNCKREKVLSSTMNVTSSKSEMVLEICKKINATTYLSGPFGKDYLEEHLFLEAGIEVKYHTYESMQYTQNWPDFVSHLSSLDLLMNYDLNTVEDFMIKGRRYLE